MSMFNSLSRTIVAATGMCIALVAVPATAAPYLGPEPVPVRLITSVTVTGPDIHLDDLFTGLASSQNKVVAAAPIAGQHMVLANDFLTNLARTNNIDWQPTDQYQRAVVYRPGQTLTPTDILAAVKADLITKGMSPRLGLRVLGTLPTLLAPSDASQPILVREGYFDPASKDFMAVLEIAGADGAPQFMKLRGTAVPVISVPVLKQDAGRTAEITADMLEQMDMPEEMVKGDVATDASQLIGKTPHGVVKAHHVIRQNEVSHVTLIDVPVLKAEMRRDGVIGEASLMWQTINSAEVPPDAVVDKSYLIGKSPRSTLAGGAPIRRGDVIAVRQLSMAVAARDLPRGAILQKNDVNWVSVSDNEIAFGAVTDNALLNGRAPTHPIRAGDTLHENDLKRPTVVTRGKLVTMIYMTNSMKLTVPGEAMEDGGQSQVIRVSNEKSKMTVQAEVVDADTVRVVSQQSAMQ